MSMFVIKLERLRFNLQNNLNDHTVVKLLAVTATM